MTALRTRMGRTLASGTVYGSECKAINPTPKSVALSDPEQVAASHAQPPQSPEFACSACGKKA